MPLVQLAIIVLIVLLTEAEVIRRDKVLAWKMFQYCVSSIIQLYFM